MPAPSSIDDNRGFQADRGQSKPIPTYTGELITPPPLTNSIHQQRYTRRIPFNLQATSTSPLLAHFISIIAADRRHHLISLHTACDGGRFAAVLVAL